MTQSIGNTLFGSKGINVDVLRLDLLHPQVSGNKWFKLKYYLEAAKQQGKNAMVSFGGAYSNHLVAMASVCAENGMRSTGIIRGEENMSNHSIEDMKRFGMHLIHVTREQYKNKEEYISKYLVDHHDDYYIAEGGAGFLGVEGTADIMKLISPDYTHVICAVGTGTTLSGLINGSPFHQQIMGVNCVKFRTENNSVSACVQQYAKKQNYSFISGYEFGGFGKKNDELIAFMNKLSDEEKIPTDFVYTGKLFFAVYDMISKNEFIPGSKCLLIHSGGLQGNRSLPIGLLHF
ncbi:MAG: pyridoxal-phosphate dependent enzyme [Flavitalea sp.]